jgi:hypothetical protein
MAGMAKEAILTSCRSNDPFSDGNYSHSTSRDQSHIPHDLTARRSLSSTKPRPPDKSASFWLNSLCLLGTSTGIIGFVLQFEGFRGISWACSIAQLVTILIMTVVRAIVRRGMLDKPVAVRIPQGFEMEWLALRIGYVEDYLLELSKPTSVVCPICGTPRSAKKVDTLAVASLALLAPTFPIFKWQLAPGLGSHYCITPSWTVQKKITPPRDARIGWNYPHSESASDAQRVVCVRNRLQDLTQGFHPNTRRIAESVADTIKKIMELFPWPTDQHDFTWFIDVQTPKHETNKVSLTTKKLSKKTTAEKDLWQLAAQDIESILSLWMYYLKNEIQNDDEAQKSTQKSPPTIRSFRRILGPSTSILKRDLAWWAGAGVAEALDGFNWKDDMSPETLNLGFGGEGKFSLSFNIIQRNSRNNPIALVSLIYL